MPKTTPQPTPGPWVMVTDGMPRSTAARIIAERPYGGIIAEASSWWYDTVTARANARLIAAAPEMLAVLKRIASSDVECWHREHARAIIAKVGG